MKNQLNSIGISAKKAENLTHQLNELLSSYQVFYMNTRGFHWNIKGQNFFELHLKFEELYNNLQIKIDEIAERILTLEGTPEHTYTDYLKNSVIKEEKNTSDGRKAVSSILHSFTALLIMQRSIMLLAQEAEDEGTSALMSDYIREQEKLVWMYNAWSKK